MSDDEPFDAEEDVLEDEDAGEPAEPEKRSSHGPGLRLGILLGIIAGAVAARLLTPASGAGQPSSMGGSGAQSQLGGPLATIRSRLQDASLEAREAAEEAERRLEQRYRELTDKGA